MGHFGASCFDLIFFPFCRNGSDEAIVQCKQKIDVHFASELVQ